MEQKNNSSTCMQNLSNNRYLPNESIVLQGAEVFNIFFQGTQWKDIDQNGREVTKNMQTEWGNLDQGFQNVTADILDLNTNKTGTMLSIWYDVLGKVMKMWE